MDINRFTEKAQEAFQAANQGARRLGHQQLEPEHVLYALLEQEPGLAVSILRKADVNTESLKANVARHLEKLPRVSGSGDQVYLSGRLNRLVATAEDEAKKFKDQYVSVEHLL